MRKNKILPPDRPWRAKITALHKQALCGIPSDDPALSCPRTAVIGALVRMDQREHGFDGFIAHNEPQFLTLLLRLHAKARRKIPKQEFQRVTLPTRYPNINWQLIH